MERWSFPTFFSGSGHHRVKDRLSRAENTCRPADTCPPDRYLIEKSKWNISGNTLQ